MATRTLSIRRERLGELTTSELTSVVAASGRLCEPPTGPITADLCPTWDCTGCHLTCGC